MQCLLYMMTYEDDHEIVYFSVHCKTKKLISSPASHQELKLMSRVEMENCPISQGSQSTVSMVERIFEFRVKK